MDQTNIGLDWTNYMDTISAVDEMVPGPPTVPENPAPASKWGIMGTEVYGFCADTLPSLPSGAYTTCFGPSGILFKRIDLHADELLNLPDGPSERVIESIRDFWQRREKFRGLGFIYKRGVLLHGAPGSGKTAAIVLTAKELISSGGIVLIFGQASPEALMGLRRLEPNRPLIVIIEDIDELTAGGDNQSVLLNLLDGETQIENVVYIATTNFISELDDRIKNRPSRFDEVIEVGFPSADARGVYLRAKLLDKGISLKDIEHLVNQTEGLGIAHLKEVVVAVYCLGRDLDSTLSRVRKMKKKQLRGFGYELP